MEVSAAGSSYGGSRSAPTPEEVGEPGDVVGMPPVENWAAPVPASSATAQPAAGQWMTLDLLSTPEPVSYLVGDYLAAGEVGILSADTGMGKSILAAALVAAALAGRPWIGRGIAARRVMVIDEEQPGRVVTSRLRALGVLPDQLDRLMYSRRQGVQLGDCGPWDAWLEQELTKFNPDLVIVDTLAAATAVADINDNTEAVRIMGILRGIAERHDAGVLVAAHHRKGTAGEGGHALMGARQWAGQADAHMVLTHPRGGVKREEQEDGAIRTQRTIVHASVEKLRDGFPGRPQQITIESRSEDNVLNSMTVRAEPLPDVESVADEMTAAVRRALAAGPLRPGELAAAVGRGNTGAFKVRMDKLIAEGVLAPRAAGAPYALSEEPRI